jgi:hypothetical protein
MVRDDQRLITCVAPRDFHGHKKTALGANPGGSFDRPKRLYA